MEITRRFEFDAGHRVLGHEGKCRFFHGHRYVAEVTVRSEEGLDNLQRVVDFGQLKSWIGEWLDTNWDHNTLINSNDPLLPEFRRWGQNPYVFEDKNPTAETMADSLFHIVQRILLYHTEDLVCSQVRIYETPGCWADYRG